MRPVPPTRQQRPGRNARSLGTLRTQPHAGFTLIEVLVALAVGGLVLAALRATIISIADGATRVHQAAVAADATANGERTLRALLGQADVGTDSTRTFAGDVHAAQFTTWCDTPDGWPVRCEAAVLIDSIASQPSVVAVLSTGDVLRLRTGFARGSLCYLVNAANGGRWLTTWPRALTPPLAVGVVLDGDTAIVRIGERE